MKNFHYKNLAANATTVIKTGGGVLHTLTINTAGATSNTITIYDNTAASGTKIATINGEAIPGQTFLYDVEFITGLTVIIATGTAADITLSYE